MEGVVIATGSNTFFGRTAKLVAGAGRRQPRAEGDVPDRQLPDRCRCRARATMVAVRVYEEIVIADNWGVNDALGILQFVLVLLVASIPVAMPAVFSITMALGALALSKQKAIVSKLSAIEEMAGVDILCSDKTGTLTKNQLTVDEPVLFAAKDAQDCILAGALASKIEDRDAIDSAVIAALQGSGRDQKWKQIKFRAFRPRQQAHGCDRLGRLGQNLRGRKRRAGGDRRSRQAAADIAQKVNEAVEALAAKGSRALGVARSDDGGYSWALLGILPMFDPPRDDSKATIKKANAERRPGQDDHRRRHRYRD